MFSQRKLSFTTDGRDWPNREASRFVKAAGLTWHVQISGQGPVLLLLHGTGASTHSWRLLEPLLRPHFTVVALDFPGHGFTQSPPREFLTLPGMAAAIAELLREIDVVPDLAAGHSAGAAVIVRMTLDKEIKPRGLVSLNGALIPFGGVATHFFAPLAKFLSISPLIPRLLAWKGNDTSAVDHVIRSTGSTIDAQGLEYYRRLASSPDHVSATLGMMANWELEALDKELPRLDVPLLLIAGENDKTTRPEEAFAVAALVPGAKAEVLRGLGHLAHEERPGDVAALILNFARSLGVLAAAEA
ncbi:MAG: alpha/beta fold hydrolase BchO [Beijerinckiaceae bacterium]|jgi:magnesium chelatase accessory protein